MPQPRLAQQPARPLVAETARQRARDDRAAPGPGNGPRSRASALDSRTIRRRTSPTQRTARLDGRERRRVQSQRSIRSPMPVTCTASRRLTSASWASSGDGPVAVARRDCRRGAGPTRSRRRISRSASPGRCEASSSRRMRDREPGRVGARLEQAHRQDGVAALAPRERAGRAASCAAGSGGCPARDARGRSAPATGARGRPASSPGLAGLRARAAPA